MDRVSCFEIFVGIIALWLLQFFNLYIFLEIRKNYNTFLTIKKSLKVNFSNLIQRSMFNFVL